MTKYAITDFAIGNLGPSDFFIPDTTQRFPLGAALSGHDVDGIFGRCEFVYAQAAATITPGQLCVIADANQVTVATNTANQARSVVVARCGFSSGQYGWFQLSGGMIPVKAAASVAAGAAVGIDSTTGGSVNASSAGRELEGVVSLRASTATRTPNMLTKNGSNVLRGNSAGVFIGQAVSGTGIPGSTTVTGFTANNEPILNNAATADGLVTITFTDTGFIEVSAPNGITTQGRIT